MVKRKPHTSLRMNQMFNPLSETYREAVHKKVEFKLWENLQHKIDRNGNTFMHNPLKKALGHV